MSISGAFNFIVNLQSRQMTFQSFEDGSQYLVKAAPSNFFRNFSNVEEITVEGFEFVLSKLNLVEQGFTKAPSKGDRLIDSEYGDNTIDYIKPMTDIGGAVIGYRVRTG